MEKQLFNGSLLNQKTILGHPSGLFVLFFTEMWERFSYYGMRAILVLFLVSSIIDGGWGWDRSEALVLYGWYTGLVYITPIFGGFIADKYMGYRKAVILGAFLMTLGHLAMAFEVTADFFLFIGLSLLIIGNGFFKPNISSIVGQLYKTEGKDKDAGYTIFYMGINSGAFLGILLCGYIGENINWHYGFGLAGIFFSSPLNNDSLCSSSLSWSDIFLYIINKPPSSGTTTVTTISQLIAHSPPEQPLRSNPFSEVSPRPFPGTFLGE